MWTVEFFPAFRAEAEAMPTEAREELAARAQILRLLGPAAKRPYVDTLKGSKHANMKELRFSAAGGVWRVAFAFDPSRSAILLVAGNKSGASEKTFYNRLIAIADRRFDTHLRESAR